jgi:serine protease Do
MRVWKIAGGSMALLGGLALVLAASAQVSGQQRVIVRRTGPMAMARAFAGAGNVRLGVSIKNLTPEDVTKLKIPGPAGVLIDDVDKDSPAAKGGVLKGDVAVAYDGDAVKSAAQLTRLVRESVAGRVVKLAVMRDGKRVELSVTPEEAEGLDVRAWIDQPTMRGDAEREIEKELRILPHAEHPKIEMDPLGSMKQFQWQGGEGPDVFTMSAGRGRLGVTVQDLSPDLAEFFGVKEGALVTTVQKDTPAAKAGIKAGDVITAIDGTAVSDPSQLVAQLREKSGEVTVTVMRDKKPLTLKATLEKPGIQKHKIIIPGVPS